MRHGRIISTEPNKDVTAQHLASLMVGRSVLLRVDKSKARPSTDKLLQVDALTALGDRGDTAVNDLSFAVHAGEIVGLAGVQEMARTNSSNALQACDARCQGQSRSAAFHRSTHSRDVAATRDLHTFQPIARGSASH
jgi:ABC-type uncharacterized transport system ATPase subunit